MKYSQLFFIAFILLFVSTASSQTDGEQKTIKIKAENSNTSGTVGTSTTNTTTNKSSEKVTLDAFELKKSDISMLPTETYIDNNKQFQKKANKSFTEGDMDLGRFKKDMDLGFVKSNSATLKIVYRDYQYVDGDRVRIYLNGVVVKADALLTGSFKGISVDLPKGFNTIEFEALNMGSSYPNTAELQVYDDNNEVIAAEQWILFTGYKAKLVVVKE